MMKQRAQRDMRRSGMSCAEVSLEGIAALPLESFAAGRGRRVNEGSEGSAVEDGIFVE